MHSRISELPLGFGRLWEAVRHCSAPLVVLPATEQTSHPAELVVSGSGGAVFVICAFASGRDA